jgi:hypothetical protein
MAQQRFHVGAAPAAGFASRRTTRACALLLLALAALSGPSPARAEVPETLRRLTAIYQNQLFRLIVNVHQPERGGRPAPYLDEKGWHYRDRERPIILAAGDLVEVTGVYGYGDRSIFLELSRPWDREVFGVRPRVRVRIEAEDGPEEPELQEEQIRGLIARMMTPVFPLEVPPREEETEESPPETP